MRFNGQAFRLAYARTLFHVKKNPRNQLIFERILSIFFHSEIALELVSGPKVHIVIQMNPFYFVFTHCRQFASTKNSVSSKKRESECTRVSEIV